MTQHPVHPVLAACRHLRPALLRRRSIGRQVVMGALLCILAGIIWGYRTITDPGRVRDMAQSYLSRIVGGRVTIGKASLSIFEGLRLEGVNVDVDDQGLPDSRIFTARTFIVRASPGALLSGNIEAAQILAVAPQIHLCENLDTGEWNYQRLNRVKGEKKPEGRRDARPIVLPEVLLRAGMIVCGRISDGQHRIVGRLAIDGNLTPVDQLRLDGERINQYTFDLSGREPLKPQGPRLRGQLDLSRPAVSADLSNIEFDSTIHAMLPAQVQRWWDQHELAGRIRIPQFNFTPAKEGNDFHIAVEFDDVKLTLRPEDLGGPRSWPKPASVVWLAQQPLRLRSASGRIVFTPGQVRIAGISGKVEENTIAVSGVVGGYSANAPMSLRIVANNVQVPRLPRYLAVLPQKVRKEYSDFLPVGRANLAVAVTREPSMVRRRGIGLTHARAVATLIDCGFCYDEFVYPMQRVTGKLILDTRENSFTIRDVTGHGTEGGPNAGTVMTLNGVVAPINRDSEVDLHIAARNVQLDPDLRGAMPGEVREALALFDPPGGTLRMRGDVAARVRLVRKVNGKPDRRLTVDVDVDIADAQGAYEHFAYPIRHAQGAIRIRSNHLEVDNVIARNGDATVTLNGTLRWGKGLPVTPDFTVVARAVPVDEDLRGALPEEQGSWLETAGLRGVIDVDGRIFLSRTADEEDDVDIGLDISLKKGAIWPVHGEPAVKDISADLNISLARLILRSATGKRADAPVTGSGYVAWSGPRPEFGLKVQAQGVPADKVLYELCPLPARQWWDRLHPSGRADIAVVYSGSEPITEAMVEDGPADDPSSYSVSIRPRGLSLKPADFPLPLESVTGEILIAQDKVTLKDLAARHGEAMFKLSGESHPDDTWSLGFSASELAVSDELLAALPRELGTFAKSIELKGTLSLDCPKITIGTVGAPDVAATEPAAPAMKAEIEGRLSLAGGSMDLGASLTDVNAAAAINLTLQGGNLHALRADINADSLLLAGRPMKAMQCRVIRPPGRSVYQFRDLQGRIAGGKLAGQIDLSAPSTGASEYAVAAVLKDVDVGQLLGGDQKVRGQLTGNLTLHGSWDNPADRRGRGDVQVQGKELYHVPVVFGLIQIANLAMPIKSPFNEATARYSVEGQKLILERMELRTANMLMEGSGTVDFASKLVNMGFTTHNPQWPQIPVIGPLLDTARKEFLQIHVTGKVEDPDVNARSLRTFSTTVDEVLKGDPKKPGKKTK